MTQFLPLRYFLPTLIEETLIELGEQSPAIEVIQRWFNQEMPSPLPSGGIPIPGSSDMSVWDVVGFSSHTIRLDGMRIVATGVLDVLTGFEPRVSTPGYPLVTLLVSELGKIRLEVEPNGFWLELFGPSFSLQFHESLLRSQTGTQPAEVELTNLGYFAIDNTGHIVVAPTVDNQLHFLTHHDPWLIGETGAILSVEEVTVDFWNEQMAGPALRVDNGRLQLPASPTQLTIQHGAISLAGHLALIVNGLLDLPVGHLAIPPQKPLQLRYQPNDQFRLRGSAELTLSNGLKVETYLILDDPEYAFSIAASGLRFEVMQHVVIDLPQLPSGQQIDTAVTRILNRCNQSINMALLSFIPTDNMPVPAITDDMPPFDAWETTLSFAPLSAWANRILADAKLGITASYAATFDTVNGLLSALSSDAQQAKQYLLDAKNERDRQRHLTKAAEAIAKMGGEYDPNSAELNQALTAVQANLVALLDSPLIVQDHNQAIALVQAVLEFDATEELLGRSNPAQLRENLPDLMQRVQAAHYQKLGLDPATGLVQDEQLFHALDREAIEEAMQFLLNLTAETAVLDGNAAIDNTAMQSLAMRWRSLILSELDHIPIEESDQRLQLLADLQTIIELTEAGLFSYPDSVTLPDGTEEAISPELDLHNVLIPETERTLTQSDDSEAIVTVLMSLRKSFWDWLVQVNETFADETIETINRTILDWANDIQTELADVVDPLQLGIDLLDTLSRLSNWLQLQSPSNEALAEWIDTLLPTAVLPDLTHKVTQSATAAKAWWQLNQYTTLALETGMLFGETAVNTLQTACTTIGQDAFASAQTLTAEFVQLLPTTAPLDIQLPSNLELSRIYGGIHYNRTSNHLKADFSGRMKLLDDQQYLAISGGFDNTFFYLNATGKLHLGNGIWLEPIPGEPILSLETDQFNSYRFDVNGRFLAPHATGTKLVDVTGELGLIIVPTGQLVVDHFEAGVDGQNLDWELPGNIVVKNASFSIAFDASTKQFKSGMGGKLQIAETEVNIAVDFIINSNDPTDIQIDSQLNITTLILAEQIHISEAEFRLQIQTQPLQGTLVAVGTTGFFPVDNAAATKTYTLLAQNTSVSFIFDTTGFLLTLSQGSLFLPPVFIANADDLASEPPSINIATAPLTLRYDAGGSLSFTGSLTFKDFGVAFDKTAVSPRPGIYLDEATLHLPQISQGIVTELPMLDGVNGRVNLPLPDRTLVLEFDNMRWDMEGLPTVSIYLGQNEEIPLGKGFKFTILGGSDQTTGFSLLPNGNEVDFELAAGLMLTIPGDMISDGTDPQKSHFYIGGSGRFHFKAGQLKPTPYDMECFFGGDFHIGGKNGLMIENGEIRASGIENVFAPTTDPGGQFIIALTGDITLPKGPTAGLDNARFIFDGTGIPTFDLDGISGGMGNMPLAGDYLPINITKLDLKFGDGDLPAKLHPLNTTITISAEMMLMDNVTGGMGGLEVGLDENGRLQLFLDALYVDVANMEIATFAVSGGMAVGGLKGTLPDDLVLAGKMGGKMNGAGFEALVAMDVKEISPTPLGLSIDVSLGQAGIPLGPTGFLLTGVQGGVSYTGSNADPDELRSYITIDNSTHTVTKGDIPNPTVANVPNNQQIDTSGSQKPNQIVEYKCPDEPCPPRTVGILYEPHPDKEAYPHRIIYKFSAIDKKTVNRLLDIANVTPAALESMSAKAIGDTFAAAITDLLNLELLFPSDALTLFQSQFSGMIEQTAVFAFNGQTSVYDAIVTAVYKGLEADEVNVKLTGTFSYTGLSVFLSVTGGIVISPTTQAAGIIGSLNLLGIPIGKLRGFLTINNDQGLPDPALCGDLDVALGPLELGRLRTTLKYGIDFVGVATDIAELIGTLSTTLIDNLFTAIDAVLYQANNNDPVATLNDPTLAPEQIAALVALLMQQTPTAAITQFFADLAERLWERYNPEFSLCGSVQPKLFGMPLDGELVGVSGMVGKTAPDEDIFLAAKFSFSPTGILSKIFYGVLPAIDQMTLSYRLALPNPVPLIQAGMMADFDRKNGMVKHTADGINHVLQYGIATIDYELAPLGIKLVNAEARMLSPNLLDHPAHPRSKWTRPEDRRRGYPSRVEVALAALEDNKLADVFWLGTAVDIQTLPKFKKQKWVKPLSLREDYFPHGGILGAAWLALPPIMLHAPHIKDYLDLISPRLKIEHRIDAANRILNTIVNPEEVGKLAFYVPAPNPPMAAFKSRRRPKPAHLLEMQKQHEFTVDDMEVAELYSFSESFVKGEIGNKDKPMTLLGVPVGYGNIELRPGKGPKPVGFFRFWAAIPQDSWLQAFLGSVRISGIIRNKPDDSIEQTFGTFQRRLKRSKRDAVAVINNLAASLVSQLPKLSLSARAAFHVPEVFNKILDTEGNVDAHLQAYSLLYNPDIVGDSVIAKAKRNGGVAMALSGGLMVGKSFGFDITGTDVEIALFPSAVVFPGMAARFAVDHVGLPFGLPAMEDAEVDFHFEAGEWLLPESRLSIKGQVGQNELLIESGNDNSGPFLNGTFALKMALVGDIGPIYKPGTSLKLLDTLSLNTTFEADVTFTSRLNGGVMEIRNGRFRWNNKTWTVPTFTVQASINTQAELATEILQTITTNGFNIFNTMLSNVEDWFNALYDSLLHISNLTAQYLARILKSFPQSTDEIAKKLGKLFDDVQDVIEALFNVASNSMTAILESLRGAGFKNSQDIANAMYNLYKGDYASELAKLFYNNWGWNNPVRSIAIRFKNANYTLSQTITGLKSISTVSLSAIIKAVYENHTTNMATVLDKIYAAGFKNSQDIADAIHYLYGDDYAAKLAKLFYDNWGWKNPANTIADRFEKADFSIGATIAALNSLGVFTINQIIQAIVKAWGRSMTILTNIVKGFVAAGVNNYTAIFNGLTVNGFTAFDTTAVFTNLKLP